jgi:hypothetical protein
LTPFREIPGVGSVETLHTEVGSVKHFKCRNVEMLKNTFWCKFRIPGVGSVETLHHRNVEMSECRNAKNTFWCRFRIPGVGVSKHFTTGIPKCGMPKCEKHLLVQVSDTGSWSVEILLHRNAKCRNAKCEIAKALYG